MVSMGILRTEEGLLLKLKTIIVIPDIFHRESRLAFLRMDPRRLLAGMTKPKGIFAPDLRMYFLVYSPGNLGDDTLNTRSGQRSEI